MVEKFPNPISIDDFRKLMKDKPVKKKLNHPESKLQQACVYWFDMKYKRYSRLLFAVPNGGARNKVEAQIMTAEGVRPGVADMFLSVPKFRSTIIFAGLYIEFKIGRNKQSDAQESFQKLVEAQGYSYIVVRTTEEFMQAINEYLN